MMALTSVFRTLLAWLQFRRALREHPASGAQEPPEAALKAATVT
jgi:hypothetical protein